MAFVDRLETALRARGFEPRMDRTDIHAFEDWRQRIYDLIAQTDSVVFVLSPQSVASPVCLEEIKFAASLNKRFAPIECQPVRAETVPEELARLNWILFQDATHFEMDMNQLAAALLTDIEWIRKHTEFGEHARRWDTAGRPGPGGLMLRPPLLTAAEAWIDLCPRGAPEPTGAIRDFIAASREAFDEEQAAIVTSQANLLAQIGDAERIRGNLDGALRLCLHAARRSMETRRQAAGTSQAAAALATAVCRSDLRLVLCGHENSVSSAAFSADGSRIVTASGDKTARIWDAATGREISILRGHDGSVSSAAFSPDGSRVVTASGDKTTRIWDVATGKEISILRGHNDSVFSAAFSPDGSRIVTASGARTARIWNCRYATMSAKDLVAEVCIRRLRGLTKLTRDEMRLVGYPDSMTQIDVCAGIE
jgi:hypothetical protein